MIKKMQFIAFTFALAILCTACAGGDRPESIVEESRAPMELYSLRTSEGSGTTTEDDAEVDEGDKMDEGDEGSGDGVYDIDNIEPVNPMLKYLAPGEDFPPPPFNIDLDFTTFGGDIFDEVFSEVMFLTPEDFVGQTVRFIGPYAGWPKSDDGGYFHFVLVDDEAGCCVRFVDIAWSEEDDPGEYPVDNTVVDIVGVFNIEYDEEWDYTFPVLEISYFVVLGGDPR